MLLPLITAAGYGLLGAGFLLRLRTPGEPRAGWLQLGTLVLALLHALVLTQTLAQPAGLDFSFANATSLIALLVVLVFLATSWLARLDGLGAVVLPLAALGTAAMLLPSPAQILDSEHPAPLALHIVLSLGAYSLLAVAALQALLMSWQDMRLRHHHPGGLVRALPALQTMEKLLFRLVTAGFVLLSLALASGFVFLDGLFQPQLLQKTVLSIIAWVVFGVLLWGRYRAGWRGQTAVRWSLAGFVLLLLAYLGSKFVMEILLG